MASIIKRNNKYKVVYYYTTEDGEQKQKWETFSNHKDALKRKAEIETASLTGTLIAPTKETVSSFMEQFVSLYGEKKWSVSIYDSNCSLIRNYINPIIGH